MEENREALIINELVEDVYSDVSIVGYIPMDLGQPLVANEENDVSIVGYIPMDLGQPLVANEENERELVPRNNDYFEVTIPQYMGDLFIEHFRMSCYKDKFMLKLASQSG
ncbi:hypothetical protein QE152_g13708 [Popillia japonica]|uniref:Uncharacterized protein n=1 Tax=Popillia japonica TaxID=7064 RepID=A0AAW1L8Y4_POPJA